tara:strand:+ start:394 stop:723 length:330 start_codon:yes stop_codon:yes gene_type:complete
MNEKVLDQLIKKNLIYRYDESNDLYVIPVPVKKWNDKEMAFQCPFCYNKWKKNGEPYKNGIHKYHFHGLTKPNKDGNYGLRTPHCTDESKRYWKLGTFQFDLIGGNLIY